MPHVPPHIGALIEARLQVEEERRQLQYARDALAGRKSTRNGFAVLMQDDNRFEIIPIGDTEIEPGSPKSWEAAYAQVSGENWENLKAENRAARPQGATSPIHQEGTTDAMMLRKEAARQEARQDAIERNKRKTIEEREYMKRYAADAKAAGAKMDLGQQQTPHGAQPSLDERQSRTQGPMTAAKMQAMNEAYRKTA